MATIEVKGSGACAEVKVDGVPVGGIRSLVLNVEAGKPATAFMQLAAMGASDVVIEGATLLVKGVQWPDAVEEAVLDHLCRKYPITTAFKRGTGGFFDVGGGSGD